MIRKPSHANERVMSQAIEKASRLVELLTKENQELKIQIQKLDAAVSSLSQNNSQLNQQIDALTAQLHHAQQHQKQAHQGSLSEQENKLMELQRKFDQKSAKNKSLHERISTLTGRNQDIEKALERERRRYCSLQNENEYLLRQFSGFKDKENNYQCYQSQIENEFKKECQVIDRKKQAFARRCDEYKSRNDELYLELAQARQQTSHLEIALVSREAEIEQHLQRFSQTIKIDAAIHDIANILQINKLGVSLILEEIHSFITFRIQHLEKMLNDILRSVQHSELKERGNLTGVNEMAQRLATYVDELLKSMQ